MRSLEPRFGGKPQKNVDQVSFTTSPDEVGVVCALQWLSLAGSLGGCVECCLSFAWCLSTAINTTVQSGSLHTCLAVTPDDTLSCCRHDAGEQKVRYRRRRC